MSKKNKVKKKIQEKPKKIGLLLNKVFDQYKKKQKISEKKDYTPLSYTYLEDCLTEIIKDDNKVSYIIDYLKENREIKTSLEIKRIKNDRN